MGRPYFIGAVIFVYMLFFADSGEGPVTQAMLMAVIMLVIVVLLPLLSFLDSPFHPRAGWCQARRDGAHAAHRG